MSNNIEPIRIPLKAKYRQIGAAGFKGQWAAPGWHQK